MKCIKEFIFTDPQKIGHFQILLNLRFQQFIDNFNLVKQKRPDKYPW